MPRFTAPVEQQLKLLEALNKEDNDVAKELNEARAKFEYLERRRSARHSEMNSIVESLSNRIGLVMQAVSKLKGWNTAPHEPLQCRVALSKAPPYIRRMRRGHFRYQFDKRPHYISSDITISWSLIGTPTLRKGTTKWNKIEVTARIAHTKQAIDFLVEHGCKELARVVIARHSAYELWKNQNSISGLVVE